MRKIVLMSALMLQVAFATGMPLYQIDFENGLDGKWRTLRTLGGYIPDVATQDSGNSVLRLTDRSHDLSTATTLDYEFPTADNNLTLEFDYYSYGGCEDGDNDQNSSTHAGEWGGDGMNIILYDTSAGANPRVGASGGSMGYANGNIEMVNGSYKDQEGFFKGWLGIGLDEFGVYGVNIEKRRGTNGTWYSDKWVDGLEKPNSVVIRGSEASGYRLLYKDNLPNIARKLSDGNSTYLSGHYQLNIDSTDADHLYITLKRKQENSQTYTTIINRFDAMRSENNQGAKPQKFRIAFSSGTGGACNNHEIDNVKIYGKGNQYNQKDFGDAPDKYTHVSHKISKDLYLGLTPPDGEDDQQSSQDANGDGSDDNDSIANIPLLHVGDHNYSVEVKAYNNTGKDAYITAWIDFDQNGTFEERESLPQQKLIVPSNPSIQTIKLEWNDNDYNNYIKNAKEGKTYLRVRLSTSRILRCDEEHYQNGDEYQNNFLVSPDGEVEDYVVNVVSATDTTPANLIADYHFDECDYNGTSGEVKDSNGSFNLDTLRSVTTSSDGVVDRSVKFDGGSFDNSGRIQGSVDINTSKSFSLSFWIKPNEYNQTEGILNLDSSSLSLKLDTNGTMEIDAGGSIFYVDGQIDVDSWSYITIVYDKTSSASLKIYKNENLVKTIDNIIPIIDGNANELMIGAASNDEDTFNGQIDELKIYSGVLDESKIGSIYMNENAGKNSDGSDREASECFKPFECDYNSYVFTSAESADYTQALLVKIVDQNVSSANDSFAEAHINAIGFNPVDGFIYGLYYQDNSIVKVDSNYHIKRVAISPNDNNETLSNRHYYLGDVSKDGIYYLTYENSRNEITTIDVVDLNNSKFVETITLTYPNRVSKISNADFSINPIDDNLYMVNERNGQLVRINLTGKNKGQVEELGYVGNIGKYRSVANFFDVDGNFYFSEGTNRGSLGIYKIDISHPWSSNDRDKNNKARATFFSSAPISAGDGARCALAPITDKAILSLDKAKVSVLEKALTVNSDGSNGREINVTIRSNKPLANDVHIIVGQISDEGSATADSDYIKRVRTITFPQGITELTFRASDVIDDSEIENTENFFYLFGVDTNDKEVARFEQGGLAKLEVEILDDDTADFTAFDPDESASNLEDRKIKTKIVGKEFNLTLASFNTNPNLRDFNSTSTMVRIATARECNERNVSKILDFGGFSLFTVPDDSYKVDQNFTIDHAIKDARVQFVWQDNKYNHAKHASCSADHFAIRPEKYIFQKPADDDVLKAGNMQDVKIIATKYNSSEAATKYNENSVSFVVEANQSNQSCDYNQSDLDVSSINQFRDGVLDGNFSYKNVGVIDLNISELRGDEFAKIDENDTNITQRLISPAHVSVKFVPFGYKLSADYNNTHTSNNYAFYGGLARGKGPKWSITIEAIDSNGNTLSNFDKSCGAIDVPFSIDLNITSDAHPKLVSNDGNISGNRVDSNISKDDFNHGKATTDIMINFDKPIQPINPTRVKIDQITASTPIGGGSSVDGNITNVKPVGGVTYQYMRAYVQSPVEVIGSKTLRTQFYYETFESSGAIVKAKDKKSLSKSGDRNWYQVNYDNTSGLMSFSNPFAKYPGRVTITNEGNTTLRVDANDLPEKNRVTVKVVKPEFSIAGDDKISTSVSFIPNTANWAGKGKEGKTVDTDVSKRNRFKKLNW